MRKRNQVVFSMLEAEAEYVQQLHILVNNFLRPLRMAASSKKPSITHDDVSSIFLNRWLVVRLVMGVVWLSAVGDSSEREEQIFMTTIVFVWFTSETIMFLHQIFYQGLKARIASWPTLVLGERQCDPPQSHLGILKCHTLQERCCLFKITQKQTSICRTPPF